MRKFLLMGAAISFMAATPMMAFANGDDNGGQHQNQGAGEGDGYHPITIDGFLAFAAANNDATVGGSEATLHRQSSSASTTGSFDGSKGVSSQAQNSGANSALQNSLALAYVKNPNPGNSIGIGVAVAGAGNQGGVYGNEDQTGPWSSWDHDDGQVTQSASIGSSYNGFTGVAQANQNVGDNSVLQNSTAVAAVNPVTGTYGTLGVALAGTGNDGMVGGNYASNHSTASSSTVNSSFDGSKGVLSLNQNSGANSLMQNSAAVGTVTLQPTKASTLAAAVATAMNSGNVECNTADAANGSNSAAINNSFNGSTGVFQASQNSGANSLVQNSVSVGAVN